MITEIKAPSPGESITEVQLATWLVNDGDFVERDAEIAEIDSDKATLSINAENAGKINILVKEGETIGIGTVIGTIDTSIKGGKKAEKAEVAEGTKKVEKVKNDEKEGEVKKALKPENGPKNNDIHFSPIAKKIMAAHQISPTEVINHFGSYRVSRKDISNYIAEKKENKPSVSLSSWGGSRDIKKEKMSTLRIKLSQRLVAVKNQTAMLTTFNEVDMSAILTIRKQYKDTFKEKFDVSLGFMSFFTKAITGAINLFPQINSMIDGEEIIIPDYADIGIAVSGPKGLVVPVIRNAEILSLAEIEQKIKELAGKARANRITLEEMSGGTFTITNGGVFGSMLSTPILNPPQSAILGMHNIVERPVAINGKVEIRPVMYVALSYDHRLIDGKESVGFLVKVKEMLENPVKLIFGGNDPIKTLLNL